MKGAPRIYLMETLTSKELTRLSIFVRDLYAFRTHDEFSTHLLASIPTITEGEFTSYNEFHSNGQQGVVKSDQLPFIPHPEVYAEILTRYAKEHPFLNYVQRTKDGSTKLLSDFLTMREFRQTPLYNEFYKPLRIPYLAVMTMDLNRHHSITLSRHRSGREFSQKTRAVLNYIRPHLLQAFRNALAVTHIQARLSSADHAIDYSGHAVIALTRHGKIWWATPRAHLLLNRYGLHYQSHSDRLPTLLNDWFTQHRAEFAKPGEPACPRIPLLLVQDKRRLQIRLVADGDGHQLILEEHESKISCDRIRHLGLSHRETEVLAWVGEGKTNEEIGAIIGCSWRTVQKHLERIYIKLGVENRTAAATVARDRLAP